MKTKRLSVLFILVLFTIGCSGGGGSQSTPSTQVSHVTLSNDTSLASSIGEVQGNTLVKIPFGTTVETLKAAIVVARGATFNVYESDGRTAATTLTDTCTIVVTAENDTKATYTVAILKDPAIVAEWIGFTSECRQYVIADAEATEGYHGNHNGLLFDGDPTTVDYVIVPDSDELTLRNNGTVEVMVRVDSIHPFAGIIHKGEKRDFSDEAWGIQLWNYQGSNSRLLLMITGDDGNWIGVYGTFDLQPGQWYHIVGTWDSTKLRLYVNGVLDGETANTTGGVRNTDGSLIVGAQLSEMYDGGLGNIGWGGVIDRVIIRNDTLTPEQIQARYNNL
jgi:hypothetical protein